MFSSDFEEYNAYIVGDSQTSLLALKGNTTDTELRAVFGKMQDLGLVYTTYSQNLESNLYGYQKN